MGLGNAMRRDWDERARSNAFRYIASWRKDWDEKSFFESGEHDYDLLVGPVLENLDFKPSAKSVAEIGCGTGRMTRSFARRFHTVLAVDISPEMQTQARGYLQSFSNIRWVLSDGETLAGIESSSVDFVFSYLVLQHLPQKDLVIKCVHEMMRILGPGGVFLFQYNGSDRPTMNWKGRTISAILDRFCSIGLKTASQSIAGLVGIDPQMIGKTWRGAALDANEIEEAVQFGNGIPEGFLGQATPLAWCYGRKGP